MSRFGAAAPDAPPFSPLLMPPDPLPTKKRTRGWWIALAVVAVLFAGGGYLLARLTLPHAGPKVVTVKAGLVAGAPITAADLTMTRVASPPADAVRSLTGLVGMTSLRAVPSGATLVRSDVGPQSAYPTSGQVLVGVSVKPGQAPAQQLVPGDYVVAVEPAPNKSNGQATTKPIALTGAVQVVAVTSISGGESVTLTVPATVSSTLGAQAGSGNVALIQVPVPAPH
jgi:hypothetical protein